MDVGIYLLESQSLKDQGKSRTLKAETLRRLQSRNPLKIRASLGLEFLNGRIDSIQSQSLKDQGKSRTSWRRSCRRARSQSLKDQGKSRT